ncbi:MAG: hypothetical protein HOE30_12465 [Deltaproteobacteria bacterium]|jgi:hypothetical protein|nr:hypothetical protein [Deltaproteobacteria bacterium]MBT4264086.1 hypothetical protein [Deltaproteobacteria bacterium]MBT4638658.1 hypothetical protein [Deltaproteobacteria bacterium]
MKQNSSNRSCNSPMNIEDRGLPIESDVTRNDSKMKNIVGSVVEERMAQYIEVLKPSLGLGRTDGFAAVTENADLHMWDILLINRIDSSKEEKDKSWFSKLPSSMTENNSHFWNYLNDLHLNQILFNEESYCHGFIIGVQEGWVGIKELVIGRYYERESEKYAERNPQFPPIPPTSMRS